MVMQKLGQNLQNERKLKESHKMQPMEVADIAIEAIKILKELHNKGYVHADIKPENFVYGKNGKEKKLFLIDLGLAVKWKDDVSGNHVEYDQQPNNFRGTTLYASVHAHLGRTGPKNGSRRDYLQSLAYTLLFLHCGRLPWQAIKGKNVKKTNGADGEQEKKKEKIDRKFRICQMKILYSPRKLSLLWPQDSRQCFREFLEDVMNLQFGEDPHYDKYINLFSEIKNESPAMYGHSTMDNEPRSARWISIYDCQQAMKQRYHYNVTHDNKVLSRYMKKEIDENLFVSCVASSKNLLALIKREGAPYSDQVYKVLDDLQDKTWIEEQWDQNYHITALAGMDNGKCLVIMASGTTFSNQRYEVSDYFPEQFLMENWRKDSQIITAMATAGDRWAVVLSQSKGDSQKIQQAIELDFCYPMEGIRYRWDSGYRISIAAASRNQIAFVLNRLVKDEVNNQDGVSVEGEKQEMCLTKDFPCTEIKKNWSKNMYVSSICYFKPPSAAV